MNNAGMEDKTCLIASGNGWRGRVEALEEKRSEVKVRRGWKVEGEEEEQIMAR